MTDPGGPSITAFSPATSCLQKSEMPLLPGNRHAMPMTAMGSCPQGLFGTVDAGGVTPLMIR